MSWFGFICVGVCSLFYQTVGSSNIPKNMLIKYTKNMQKICKIFDTWAKMFLNHLLLPNQTMLKLIKELDKKDKLSDNHMKSAKEFICSEMFRKN